MTDWHELGSSTNHVVAEQTLGDAGWTRCGAGDWAIALRSPDGTLVARISPFDPTGPFTAELYHEAAATALVPRVTRHTRLEGGGDLLVMEYLEHASAAEAERFLADLASGAPHLRELAAIVQRVHTRAVASLPWCGPLDTNPANVMQRGDGTVVLTDPFYADGPNLYAAAFRDPLLVARAIPREERRYLAEIPLTASGPWGEGEQERLREALRSADELLQAE